MSWQIYWKKWGLSYDRSEDCDYPGVYSNLLVIGPLQMHWYSS